MPTPNVDAVIDWVEAEYPDLPRIQTTNCRPIAGSSTWSQHSWANAADIFVDRQTGDELAPQLRTMFGPHIRTLLWQVKDHYDHIHVDFWPTGISTPPCAGGTLRVRYRDGTVGDTFTLTIQSKGDDMWEYLNIDESLVRHAWEQGWLQPKTTSTLNYFLGLLPELQKAESANPDWLNFRRAVTNGIARYQPDTPEAGLTEAQVRELASSEILRRLSNG